MNAASAPAEITAGAVAKKRIGVLGGAFDPPHKAHLALAQVALDTLALDELRIVPTGQAWHKAGTLSPATDRLAMARLAFGTQPHMVVDERELQRAGPSYSIDTLQALQAENPQAQLFLIMGADQFAAFQNWHRWQDILDIAIICVAQRAISTEALPRFDAYKERSDRFLLLPLPLIQVSATQIRQLMASDTGKPMELGDLVPGPVARYISAHRLYVPR